MLTELQFWKTIWQYSVKYSRNFFCSILFSLISGFTVAVQPLMIKYIIDDGIQNVELTSDERFMTVVMFCCFYLVISIMREVSWGIGYHNGLKAVEGFLFEIRSALFNHVQMLCMRFYDSTSSGELFNYIMGTPIASLKSYLSQFILTVPNQLVALVVAVAAMISYDKLLTAVMLIVIFTSVCINRHSCKKINRFSKEQLVSESEASKYIDDVLHGSHAVKMYAIENDIQRNFKSYINVLRTNEVRLIFHQWFEVSKVSVAQYVGTALIYVIGAASCIYRNMTVGELVAFVSSMAVVMSGINAMLSIRLSHANASASLERINHILSIKSTTPNGILTSKSIEISYENALRYNKPCIEFKDVTFAYDDRKIFSHFSCKIEMNKSYGLVGSSGSGKSTLTKLVMRLYEADDGSVCLYDNDVKCYDLHDLRNHIGIVPQDPFLFHTSVLENIRIACPTATQQEIENAIRISRVDEFIDQLPDGINTIVGENGYGVSGGQKQRIAIARAILKKPHILIFDEATSALDNLSEKHIQNAIETLMKDHSIIIIAHRLSTIRNVDQILVFCNGEIVQQGNFEQLANTQGKFHDMLFV